MTFRISAPSKDRLQDKVQAYLIAADARRVSCSAGKKNGEWFADLEVML